MGRKVEKGFARIAVFEAVVILVAITFTGNFAQVANCSCWAIIEDTKVAKNFSIGHFTIRVEQPIERIVSLLENCGLVESLGSNFANFRTSLYSIAD